MLESISQGNLHLKVMLSKQKLRVKQSSGLLQGLSTDWQLLASKSKSGLQDVVAERDQVLYNNS